MDLMVFIAIAAAAGVGVVSLVMLVRIVRQYDGFDFDRPRLLSWGGKSTQAAVSQQVPVPANDSSTTNGWSASDAERPPSASRPSDRIAAYVPSVTAAQLSRTATQPKRSVAVNEPEQSNIEGAPDEQHPLGGGDYGRLGEQVTAVLTTAERAALEIRAAADREAEEIRRNAENAVADARASAEELRSEADAYRDETRAAADSYADEKRRAADADAAKAQAAAEEKAEAIVADAERKATEVETQALRRRDALRQSAIHLEERIAELLTTFRTVTSDLEGLLPAGAESAEEEPPENGDVVVDDTLEDALKPERTV